MRYLLLIISMYAIGLPCTAQSLPITSKTKIKTFKVGTYFEIVTADKCEDCDWTKYRGTIKVLSPDSLTLQTTHIESGRKIDSTAMLHSVYFPHASGSVTLAKNDILLLKAYKSEKSYNRKNSIGVIGGLLIITGAATAIHGIALPKGSGKSATLVSGGAQILTGISLAISSSSKRYYFRDREAVWWIKQ